MRVYYTADYDQHDNFFDSLQKAIDFECSFFSRSFRKNVTFEIIKEKSGHGATIKYFYYLDGRKVKGTSSIISAEVR